MNYTALRAQMTGALASLRQQVEDGTAPPSAALAALYAEQLAELEADNAPLETRLRVVRQVLAAASGMVLPLDYVAEVTA